MTFARTVTAFAPATVANVAVGFDLLGFALAGVGDVVTVERVEAAEPGSRRVTVEAAGPMADAIPICPEKNTASVALERVLRLRNLPGSFHIRIDKGIAPGSGMGSSAASAVGAVVAMNAFIADPLSVKEQLECAIAGEAVASGTLHADNVAPALLGGLQLVLSADPPDVVSLRVPSEIHCALVYPRFRVETRQARGILERQIELADHVRQSALLAGFLVGNMKGDLSLIRRSMVDTLIEPQRASLVPGFDAARAAALGEGALGFSLAGSGPSVFAWAPTREAACRIGVAVRSVFEARGLRSDPWISPIAAEGARVIDVSGARG
jgi:homoserine kinase